MLVLYLSFGFCISLMLLIYQEFGIPFPCLFCNVKTSYVFHALQEIESEDDGLDEEVDDDAEDEHESEDAVPAEPLVKNVVAPPAPPKDTERQLSKKELKKKEMAELDAVLAELGLGASSNSNQDETNG
jgi:hypothetical protein